VNETDSFSSTLSRVRVVLVQPSHPGNIGAAARALKTMGLARLALVRPRRFPDPEATALATGAGDVLDAASVCETLNEALAGTAFSIAMSARERDLSHPPLDARTAAREVVRTAARDEVALVFGHETAGLSNDDVLKCSALAHIPANPEYSSLNLAQAVQVMAYEVRMACAGDAARSALQPERAPHEALEGLFGHLETNLLASGFLDPAFPGRLMERLRRLFARAGLEKEEVNILRGILTAWDGRGNRKPRSD
jgi:tRNA/rRNA methyltransferase